MAGMCKLVIGFVLAGTAATAEAAPIPIGSSLNFAGQSTCNATSCSFGNAFVTSGTGAFAGFTFGTAATFAPLTYAPFTPQQIFSTTSGSGQVASFSATGQLNRSVQEIDGLTSYTFTDTGIARLTGFDDTEGSYLFTANQDGSVQGSFSSTLATEMPEPGAWAMLIAGFGLAGSVLRSRRTTTARLSRAA